MELAATRAQSWPYLAALILALCGDSARAGEELNQFERRRNLPPNSLSWLRIELGGSIALDPILTQLRQDLREYFQDPVSKLNDETQRQWTRTLVDARSGFRIRMAMSVVVFVVGLSLLITSCWRFLFGSLDSVELWGAGVSFVSGLTSMLLVIYSGPLRDIRKAVEDLAASNAIFIAYIHRVLQVSHTFTALYMRERVSFDEADRAAHLMQTAMKESIDALKNRDNANPNNST